MLRAESVADKVDEAAILLQAAVAVGKGGVHNATRQQRGRAVKELRV